MLKWLAVILLPAPVLVAQCLTFPAGVVPFSSISYVTAANTAGDQLVVGALAGGLNTLAAIPLPDTANETYCDSSVQLAPGQFYPNVYIPSSAERSGNFSAFAGLLVNPANNQPYPNGMIPTSQFGQIYAIRIGPASATTTAKGWTYTGSMPFLAAAGKAAVLLPSGKVFVNFDIYDPASGAFTSVGGPLNDHGAHYSDILLNNGSVLIVGGGGTVGSTIVPAAELFDPIAQNFSPAGATKLPHALYHTSTLLNDGRVLIVGGLSAGGYDSPASPPSGAEVYDPKTKSFSLTGPMMVKRQSHAAQRLSDGRVLIAGGADSSGGALSLAEIFDPVSNTFSVAGFMAVGRIQPFSAVLPNGQVLIGGGYGTSNSAEVYDPVKGSFFATGQIPLSLADSEAVLLQNGQVLVFGGYANLTTFQGNASAVLYNPASNTFSVAASMNSPRRDTPATLLLDGRVLVAGGSTGPSGVLTSSAELYTPTTQGLVTSQTGLTFRAAQSTPTVPPQTLAVLSPTDDIPWQVSVKTYSGGNWLSASPSSSDSKPGAPPVTLTLNVDPTGLAPQDYYGAVTLTPTDQKHPPVTVAIVFSIVPAGAPAPLQVSPGGLVFLTQVGATPAPQTFKVTNFTSGAVNFLATSTGTFFTFAPLAGTITTALPGVITVTPSTAKLTAGVYRGSIKLSFNDGSTQTVDVLMVVSAAPAGSITRDATSCTPTKLLPVLTSIAAGQTAPIAWPTRVEAQVVDDCQNTLNSGTVVASFTNGDPPISLTNLGNGLWSGTWTPLRVSPNLTVRVDARLQQPLLTGTVQQPVLATANPKVPLVAPGGVLSAGDYKSPPAAGLHVAIFGSGLADGSAGFSQVPLPIQIGSTQVLLNGQQLPVVYVSDTQVNVLVPYETPLNASLPLIVTRANAISVPVQVAVFDAQPAILATAGNGQGQGHIYKALASGAQVLADATAPAGAGDVLVMYTVGMGAVTPAVKSGEASPSSPLARVAAPVTVTIGGVPATPLFAGLSPGYVGLYQVNVVMPSGVAAGGQTPVSVSVGAKSSPPGITMGTK